MQPSTLPFDARTDEDQRPQCWKDVEAETGYSSYLSFLKALPETGPQFKFLQDNMQPSWQRHGFGEIFVLDIQKDGSTSISLTVQSDSDVYPRLSQHFEVSTLEEEPITQLLHNLRSPPENVPSRIVLWSVPSTYHPYTGIMDALGLGLKINPPFFETLFSIWYRRSSSFRPNESDHVKIGDSVATVARNYRSAGDAPPVLLVASLSDLTEHFGNAGREREKSYYGMVDEVLKGEISGRVSLHRSAIDRRSPNITISMQSNKSLNILSRSAQQDHNTEAGVNALPWIAMLPLLNLEIVGLRVRCRILQSVLLEAQVHSDAMNPERYSYDEKNKNHNILDQQRFGLRRRLEDLEESRNGFVKYMRLHGPAKWLKGKTWLNHYKDIREAISEARALDAEVRDCMQLQIRNLSIMESRKSIQLSNQQMDEAKRGKINKLPESGIVC